VSNSGFHRATGSLENLWELGSPFFNIENMPTLLMRRSRKKAAE
jgi:hypothetical protein